MKKAIALAVVLVLCIAVALPVAAAEGFVPSITYKGGPGTSEIILVDERESKTVEEGVDSCVVITSIEQARVKSTDILQEERDLLLEVYEKLSDGSMVLPIEEEHVIRELVDVSFEYSDCRVIEEHNHKDERLKAEKVTLKVDFDLGIEKDAKLAVMTYIEDKWEAIESVENNGDGTVTCIFEDVCPVAIAVLN